MSMRSIPTARRARSMKSLLVSVVVFLMSGCVTGEKASNLTLGMTQNEVVRIMGRPNGVDSRREGESSVVEYVYRDRLMSGFSWDRADYLVKFSDDRVTSFGPVNVVRKTNPLNEGSLQPIIEAQKENTQSLTAVWSQIIQNPAKIELPLGGFTSSNGFPNNSSSTQLNSPQLPMSSGGYPTGAQRTGPDGTLWFEMKSYNGATYWVQKSP